MKRYVKRPVTIEAVQWNGNNYAEIYEFISDSSYEMSSECGLIIHTLEGDHHARPGDFIIKGIKGEFYPCKPDIFEQTYIEQDQHRDETDKFGEAIETKQSAEAALQAREQNG